ncbi:MAG: hypothetical protein LUQ18_01205 [Methylococcaceae bacterium]|nr:hypothetical protein [Methylococcaceae bacterium]
MTNAETKAFNEDLDRYQAQEIAADKRDAWVEQQVEFLTSEGEEYYPFLPDRVREAIGEMNLAESILLASYAHVVHKLPSDTSRGNLADYFNRVVVDYWTELAKNHAETDYNSKW